MKRVKTTLAALGLAFLTGAAQAIPLSDLFAGGSITVANEKLFDQWELLNYEATDGRTFNPANILVTELADDGVNGLGLNFEVQNGELAIAGDDLFAFVDLFFGFRVSVLDPSLGVNGILLSIGAALIDPANAEESDVSVFILETIGTSAPIGMTPNDDLGTNEVELSSLDGATTIVLDDSAAFAPRSQVFVTKNILVNAALLDDAASLASFEQRFSQGPLPAGIPEPGSLALSLLALVGVGALQRRRVALKAA